MKVYSAPEQVNVGSGKDIMILELARLVREVVGFDGEIVCDRTKPDGTPKKLMNADRLMALGWRPSIGLKAGIVSVYSATRLLLCLQINLI